MADTHAVALAGESDGVRATEISGPGSSTEHSPQTLPLNSKRLTTQILRQLTVGLGVPSTVFQDDLRAMIEE